MFDEQSGQSGPSSSQHFPTKLVRKIVQESSSLEGIDLTKIVTYCEIHCFTDVIRPGLGVMFNYSYNGK